MEKHWVFETEPAFDRLRKIGTKDLRKSCFGTISVPWYRLDLRALSRGRNNGGRGRGQGLRSWRWTGDKTAAQERVPVCQNSLKRNCARGRVSSGCPLGRRGGVLKDPVEKLPLVALQTAISGRESISSEDPIFFGIAGTPRNYYLQECAKARVVGPPPVERLVYHTRFAYDLPFFCLRVSSG